MKGIDHLHSASGRRSWRIPSRSLAMDSSNSRPDANSHCWPVTRFSRRPASASGFASPRTFTTYARRVGYLESVLKAISIVGNDGPVEVDVIELRRKAMPGCQRNVAISSRFGQTDQLRWRGLLPNPSHACTRNHDERGHLADDFRRAGGYDGTRSAAP